MKDYIGPISFVVVALIGIGAVVAGRLVGEPLLVSAGVGMFTLSGGWFLRGLAGKNSGAGTAALVLIGVLGAGLGVGGCDKFSLDPACAVQAAQKCAAELMQCCKSGTDPSTGFCLPLSAEEGQ